MIKFNKETVLLLYRKMVNATGGTYGIREESLLDSAVEAPYHTFDGIELYDTVLKKAARLGYGLVSNHPFVDGNKRIGVFVMLTYLEINDIHIEFTDDDIIFMGLGLANGYLNYDKLYEFIEMKNKR